jgi:hypothetical protein
LFALYRRPQFYVYVPVVVLTVGTMLVAIRRIERVQREKGSNSPEYQRFAKFHRFSYAAISGIVGAQSIMFAKTTCVVCRAVPCRALQSCAMLC